MTEVPVVLGINWINARIRRREWFRPLAPVVLAQRAAAYVDMPRPSPFMQFAAPVRPDMTPHVPAEALASFRRRPLHALAISPFLVTKRIEPELPT
jgi:carbamoyltransferase